MAECAFLHPSRPQDLAAFRPKPLDKVFLPPSSSFRRPRSRASGCCSSCWRWSGRVRVAGMAALGARSAPAQRAGVLLSLPGSPPTGLAATAAAASRSRWSRRGRRGLPDPARRARRPAAPAARPLFRSLYGGPGPRFARYGPVDGRAVRRPHRPRRGAGERRSPARRRPRPRHGHRPRPGPRPGAVRRAARLGDHPAPADLDRPELDRRRHDRRRGPARSAGRPPRSAACSPRTPTRDRRHRPSTSSSTRTTAPRSTATSPRPPATPTTPAT